MSTPEIRKYASKVMVIRGIFVSINMKEEAGRAVAGAIAQNTVAEEQRLPPHIAAACQFTDPQVKKRRSKSQKGNK